MKFTILVLSEAFGSRVSSTPYLLRRTCVVIQVLLVVVFLWLLALVSCDHGKKTILSVLVCNPHDWQSWQHVDLIKVTR